MGDAPAKEEGEDEAVDEGDATCGGGGEGDEGGDGEGAWEDFVGGGGGGGFYGWVARSGDRPQVGSEAGT